MWNAASQTRTVKIIGCKHLSFITVQKFEPGIDLSFLLVGNMKSWLEVQILFYGSQSSTALGPWCTAEWHILAAKKAVPPSLLWR